MSAVDCVAIVGLGLIGGSLARDLAGRGVRVLGHDRDPATLAAARRSGAVHAALGPDLKGLEEADALVIAVPVLTAPAVLAAAAPRLGRSRLVTDAASTKRSIGEAAEALGIGERFVGAHPLAGDHRAGWEASRPGLFAGARVFLCPTPATTPEALALAERFWREIGAAPEPLDPAEHDRRLAWSSHLPQVSASALALALRSVGVGPRDLGPGGRDTTRLAASSDAIWTDIALDNAQSLGAALAGLEEKLGEIRAALAAGDRDRVQAFLAAAREWSLD